MNSTDRDRRNQTVLIIGGGIGGLAAAIGLQEVGFDVQVYEQAEEVKEVGAGFAIWRNGLEALEYLGGHEAAVQAGMPLEGAEFKTPDGSVLREIHFPSLLPDTDSDVPAGVAMHRADLQRILRNRVGDGVLHLDHECVGVEEDDGQVTAEFASGKEVNGDLLVGADGIHSVVRSSLHGNEELRFYGTGYWRAVTRIDHPISTSSLALNTTGGSRRFAALPVGDGRVYWLVTEPADRGVNRPTPDSKERLAEIFSDWHPPIPTLIDETPHADLIWHDGLDRPLLDQWGRGKITLLGDAAHIALGFAAQGACQALEDAVWLARYLDREADTAAALRAYEDHRKDRTKMVVQKGRRMARIVLLSNPIAVAARDLLFKYGPNKLFQKAMLRELTTDI